MAAHAIGVAKGELDREVGRGLKDDEAKQGVSNIQRGLVRTWQLKRAVRPFNRVD